MVGLAGVGEGTRLLEQYAAETGDLIEYRCERNPSENLQVEEFNGVSAVIADLEQYKRGFLERVALGNGGDLEIIARYGVGVESIDMDAATDAGILVTNTPGANTSPTAEWAVSTILHVAGRGPVQQARAACGKNKIGVPRLDITRKTLGVVGTGAIGHRVIELMAGFSLRVLACDPYPDLAWAAQNDVTYVSLDTLLLESDLISLHASAGHQIIGEAELARTRRSAILINCARELLVDNRAAYNAVVSGELFGYGLDDVWRHPDLPIDNINIAVSPHVGSDTDLGKIGMQTMSAHSVVDFLCGREPKHAVNRQVLRSHR